MSKGTDDDIVPKNQVQHYLGSGATHCKTKRAIIHLLSKLALHLRAATLLQQIIQSLLSVLLSGEGETRVESAVNTAFGAIIRRHGTHAADLFLTVLLEFKNKGGFNGNGELTKEIITRSL